MKIKKGVSLKDLQPQMLVAIFFAKEIYARYGVELVITSGNDGEHGENSLHYKGLALDFRMNTVDENHQLAVANSVRTDLGEQYDVVLEDTGTPNVHLHVEFQPKD